MPTAPPEVLPHEILIVDDDDELRGSIAQLLRERGYRVREAQDGKEGLAAIDEQRPELLILDLHMPKLGGWEVCRRVKGDPQLRSIRVLMMTGDLVEPEDADYGLSLGADEYIVKPFIADVLVYNVVRLLEGPEGLAGSPPLSDAN